MVERSLSMREVPGSIPGSSIHFFLPFFFLLVCAKVDRKIVTCVLIFYPYKLITITTNVNKYQNVINLIITLLLYVAMDVGRALLKFAVGYPLGEKGLDWLKIHLVNLQGEKKK